MIEIATNKKTRANDKEKHKKDAKFGWYKYDLRFALPVYDGVILVALLVLPINMKQNFGSTYAIL